MEKQEQVRTVAGLQSLSWQSWAVLAVCLLGTLASVPGVLEARNSAGLWLFGQAVAIGAGFALLVLGLRAATPGAAATGGLFTVTLYLAQPGWRTLLWPLAALFVLTFAATKFGKTKKEKLAVAEGHGGRSASQVAANLGMAALVVMPVVWLRGAVPVLAILGRPLLVASVAAMAEATADTLSSELGAVLGGEPLMITTGRRVAPGTDGAISVAGTLAGCLGAMAIALLAGLVLPLRPLEAAIAAGAGILGLFVDSLLGATLERAGRLNNDAVNFLSTCAAALAGFLLAGMLSF
ncbi:DUF92 domain-containing protein [Silvibacterium dinghuense]|uniref:DUF92 domain-containing protein n=1 Tax=Silvibacterium dinghuense TaxID=1560006 RepID=A0A4Q1SE40_9BACT|nr:DUF92 domain-containing protein [Silvibacterium dinghuense]RXS95377.1 DUF92 domain-containing protein [Silvibacterium dinghuense]GGH12786.1 hypothetical protein GCM10011586_32260 [Silvibacterium dinghuense]